MVCGDVVVSGDGLSSSCEQLSVRALSAPCHVSPMNSILRNAKGDRSPEKEDVTETE